MSGKKRRFFQKKRYLTPTLSTAIIIFFMMLPVLLGKESYRRWVLSGLNDLSGLKIDFSDEVLIFFPSPGIELKDVIVYRNFVTLNPSSTANSVSLFLSIKNLIQGRVVFSDISINKGNFRITRESNGEIEILGKMFKSSDSTDPSRSGFEKLSLIENFSKSLQIATFTASDSYLIYTDKVENLRSEILVSSFEIHFKNKSSILLHTRGIVNNDRQEFEINLSFNPDFSNYKNTEFSAYLRLQLFPLIYLRSLLSNLYLTEFRNSRISGSLNLKKEKKSHLNAVLNTHIEGLELKSGLRFSPMNLSGNFQYDSQSRLLYINNLTHNWPDHGLHFVSGSIWFMPEMPMDILVTSKYTDFESMMDFIQLMRMGPPQNKISRQKSNNFGDNFKSSFSQRKFNLKLKNVTGYGNTFDSISGNIQYQNELMKMNDLDMKIYGGNIHMNGEIFFPDHSFTANLQADNINAKKLIKNYTKSELLTGNIECSMKAQTTVENEEKFFSSLRADGNFRIRNGELLGYANIAKVIASIGKILNFTGPSGKNTDFSILESDYQIYRQKIYLNNLKLRGVGLDADAKGFLGFNSTVDMTVTVSMGGPLGKILKIPVIYSGIIEKDQPYVDPIWLTSVTIGTAATPIAPVQGLIMGSILSEYIRDIYEFAKGGDDSKNIKKELDQEFKKTDAKK